MVVQEISISIQDAKYHVNKNNSAIHVNVLIYHSPEGINNFHLIIVKKGNNNGNKVLSTGHCPFPILQTF